MSPELLFPRPGGDFLALLAGLPQHLDVAMPMRRQHRRELPGDIRHLSHLLTDERGDLRRDYLADPAALSAYLRYFLPWNIFRLGTLFSGLALDPPDGATIVDLGSGPLTAPLTLWMSRPHLRRRALNFICVDRAAKPMRLGLDTLTSLAAKQGGLAPWKVTLVKGPLDARLREKADLLIMANALNEVLQRGEGSELLDTAEALAWHLSSMLTPTGQLLVVEPGVRPSAHLIAALRRGLLHHGLNPLAPCPHTGPCPMSGRGYTAWCHFNFDAEHAPGWLKKLSDDAKLAKDNVSLSFLHFSAKGRNLAVAEGKSLVRAVSGPFELPPTDKTGDKMGDEAGDETGGHYKRFGQYACSERGLTLLSVPRRHLVPAPGTLLEATWPEHPAKDAKSGALVLPMGDEHKPRQDASPVAKPSGTETTKPATKPVAKSATKPERKPRLPSERPLERAPRPKPSAAKPRHVDKPAAQTGSAETAKPSPQQIGTPMASTASIEAAQPKTRTKPRTKPRTTAKAKAKAKAKAEARAGATGAPKTEAKPKAKSKKANKSKGKPKPKDGKDRADR